MCTPPIGSVTLSVTTSPSTCPSTVSASVSATGYDGNTFAIKDSSGTTKCSGVITAGSGTCSSWTISTSTTYNLYIPSGSTTPIDTKTASCTTPCSSYTSSSSCQSGGCYWCASPNTPSNTCVQSSSGCTTEDCSKWNYDPGNCDR